MLFGEHAVLRGKQALVCAVNKRLHMQLLPNQSTKIIINDTRIGTLELDISALQIQDPFKYVLASIMLFKKQLANGCTININAEFSSVVGLGSSAAVTVATVALLGLWLNDKPLTNDEIFNYAKQVILTVQGRGSGADLAASVYGGVLSYVMEPFSYAKLGNIPELTAIYCGYKTPTSEVIRIVTELQQQDPVKYANLFQAMHLCATRAIDAIQQANWVLLGNLFDQHHELQAALGTSDQVLDRLKHTLSAQPEIYGAKISGSGLGDCIIGLGSLPRQIFAAMPGVVQFPVIIDNHGLIYTEEYANN